jgi:hypothetical protein
MNHPTRFLLILFIFSLSAFSVSAQNKFSKAADDAFADQM